jgi:ribosomal protein L37AE/L43A
MAEQPTVQRCIICGTTGQANVPLVPQGLDDDVWMCLTCLNSPEGSAWRQARRAADPAYDRFWLLSTVSLHAECPECRQPLYVSAKARGMASAVWDVPCTHCHRRRPQPMYAFGPTEPAFDALQRVEYDFIRSRRLDETEQRVREIAQAYDPLLNAHPCTCGGRFSLAAKPRCPRCNAVAFDSFFHDIAPREKREL